MPESDSLDIGVLKEIAQHIDLSWFEWSVKLAIAAIIILFFKEMVFSLYRYIVLRMDKHISIGTLIKFNHGVFGRIQDYNMRTIKIETAEGIVKIPLEAWLSTYYTQILHYDVDIKELLNDSDPIINLLNKRNTKLEKDLTDLKNNFNEIKGILNINKNCPTITQQK